VVVNKGIKLMTDLITRARRASRASILFLLLLLPIVALPACSGEPDTDDPLTNTEDGAGVSDEDEAVGTTEQAATSGCGASVQVDPNGGRGFGSNVTVRYKNCSRNTVRVRARVRFGFDGPCNSVPPGSTRPIHRIMLPGVYDGILNC